MDINRGFKIGKFQIQWVEFFQVGVLGQEVQGGFRKLRYLEFLGDSVEKYWIRVIKNVFWC